MPTPYKYRRPPRKASGLTLSLAQKQQPTTKAQPDSGYATTKPKKTVWSIWKEVWAFLGPTITLVGLYYSALSNITIEPSVNLDPARQYATQVLISNRGNFTVYNLRFECAYGDGGERTVFNGRLSKPDTLAVSQLDPGQATTKSCDSALSLEGNQKLGFVVAYRSLLGGEARKIAHFGVRKGAPGYFLVPEAFP